MKEKIKELVRKVRGENPYKERGNPDSYSRYNEGWSDACDLIEIEIEIGHMNEIPKFMENAEAVFIAKDDYEKKVYAHAFDMAHILFELTHNFRRKFKYMDGNEYRELTPDNVVDMMLKEIDMDHKIFG